jgi:hypothetical protein
MGDKLVKLAKNADSRENTLKFVSLMKKLKSTINKENSRDSKKT